MRKNNDKLKQYSIIAVMAVICIGLVGLIYSVGQRNSNDLQISEAGKEKASLTVSELDYLEDRAYEADTNSEDSLVKIDIESINNDIEEASEIIVEPIDSEENIAIGTGILEKEEVEVPIVVVPDKPDLTPPEQMPETSDDLTNPDKIPEYDEEQTTYVPESEPVVEQQNEVRGSNLVPDSENPFLQVNIPSNGDGGEIQGENLYQDGVPAGEGDKF
jgi:hypothetical protein